MRIRSAMIPRRVLMHNEILRSLEGVRDEAWHLGYYARPQNHLSYNSPSGAHVLPLWLRKYSSNSGFSFGTAHCAGNPQCR